MKITGVNQHAKLTRILGKTALKIAPPGETCQIDWSHETVVLAGVTQTIKAAHFRLTYSRRMFIIAYPRETQEMVLDACVKAFAYFVGEFLFLRKIILGIPAQAIGYWS